MIIVCIDSLKFLKSIADYENDIIFCDPPYALGSEIIIRSKDGKVDYEKASDFMDKWDIPTGEWWEKWFREAYRTLKHGGYLIMYGIDRQVLMPKYYAHLAGFEERQSLYWFYISSLPKSTDLSKNLDKNAGAEREKIGGKKLWGHDAGSGAGSFSKNQYEGQTGKKRIEDITTPSTPLAKKYDGYKYSIAPLKQTNETIMVFQKPYKTGSALHDVLALEKGDTTCAVGALNIDGTRVPIKKGDKKTGGFGKAPSGFQMGVIGESLEEYKTEWTDDGKDRYPSQTFVDSESAKILDKQSGIKKSGTGSFKSDDYEHRKTAVTFKRGDFTGKGDIGGCSRILHTCKFEENEHDLYLYCPKVAKSERQIGVDGYILRKDTPSDIIKEICEKLKENK